MFGFGKKKKQREEAARAAAAEAEKQRLAEEMKRAEEMRQAELAKKAEAAKKAEEARQAEEEAKKVEEAQKAEEAQKEAAPKKPATKKAPAKAENAAEAVKKAPAKKAPADQAEPAPVKKAAAKKAPDKVEEPASAPAEEIGEEVVKSNGKFEIKRTSDGRYMFNVRAGNTQIIANSQIYSSMAACKNGIASIGANAPIAAIEDQTLQTINEEKCPKFQIYFDKAGQYRFNLIATNGNNILSCTQGYRQKSSCKNGIKSVINNASAPTEILKEEK